MNRISGPLGLPQSCAEMVRPSGVFTVIGLNFASCACPGCAIVSSSAAASAVALTRPLFRAEVGIAVLPLFYFWCYFGCSHSIIAQRADPALRFLHRACAASASVL